MWLVGMPINRVDLELRIYNVIRGYNAQCKVNGLRWFVLVLCELDRKNRV